MNNNNTAQEIIIHGNNPTISAVGKFNSVHTKSVIRMEDGKVYSSVCDAANDVGAIPQNMSIHLRHPEKRKHIKGFHYAYLSNVLDNPDAVFVQLRITKGEMERYKAEAAANAEKARKWDEHEAAVKAEEERKAKHQRAIEKAQAKVDRRQRIYDRCLNAAQNAHTSLIAAQSELEKLMNEE